MGTIETPAKNEYVLTLITGEDFNQAIKGNLNSIIVDSDEPISITIESSLGYLIFHNSQHHGIRYYAPRAVMQGSIEHIAVADQFDKFKLNEDIFIRVSGPTNTEVKVIIRLD